MLELHIELDWHTDLVEHCLQRGGVVGNAISLGSLALNAHKLIDRVVDVSGEMNASGMCIMPS